jgi:undecaprenyl-diphosphatase
MTFFQSAILGLVQGLTEFIPVSSTGHLILARELLGLQVEGTIAFDAVLQLATALAVIIYFRRDIFGLVTALFNFLFKRQVDSKYGRLILPLIVGTIPAIVAGIFLEGYMDTAFRGTKVVAGALIAGAVLFYFAEKMAKRNSFQSVSGPNISIKTGVFIGLFQCLALVPGFSRSGATISGGLFNGLNRGDAARFSFLLSIPIILGSGLKKIFEMLGADSAGTFDTSLIIACIFAFVSGLLAIHFLIKFLKNHSLNWFGVYRIILAVVILVWLV